MNVKERRMGPKRVRGVLGNKCARRRNLKTIHFKETIVLGNFLPWSLAVCVFFSALYLSQDGGGELFCSEGGGNYLHALLEGALDQLAACQL
jgi:hypothetical protein